MLKNKDGSYNKISVALISLISLIIIGILGFSLFQVSEIPTIDIPPTLIIITIIGIAASFMIYQWLTSKKISDRIPILQHDTPQVIVKTTTPDLSKIKIENNIKPHVRSSYNMVVLITSFIIGSVFVVISVSILPLVMSSLPLLPPNSNFTSSQTTIIDTIRTTFNILTFGLVIGGVALIMGMVTKIAND
jgi:xanthosine utilization system XapX-like protein